MSETGGDQGRAALELTLKIPGTNSEHLRQQSNDRAFVASHQRRDGAFVRCTLSNDLLRLF